MPGAVREAASMPACREQGVGGFRGVFFSFLRGAAALCSSVLAMLVAEEGAEKERL